MQKIENKVLVIGSGAYGTALIHLISKSKNNKVYVFGNNKEKLNLLLNNKSSLFEGLYISAPYKVSNSYEELFNNEFDLIILAVPSSSILEVLNTISKFINKRTIILNTSKGLYGNYYWKDEFYKINKNFIYGSINGPSFAIEMIQNELTICDLFIDEKSDFDFVKQIISTDTFKIHYEKATKISLYISSFKNLIAIGMGIIRQETNSSNTFTSMLVLAIKEMEYILEKYLNKKISIIKYSSLGDILLTATNEKSRNFSFGKEIFNLGIKQAKQKYDDITIEGLVTAYQIKKIILENKINNTIFFKALIQVIDDELDPKKMLKIIWDNI